MKKWLASFLGHPYVDVKQNVNTKQSKNKFYCTVKISLLNFYKTSQQSRRFSPVITHYCQARVQASFTTV